MKPKNKPQKAKLYYEDSVWGGLSWKKRKLEKHGFFAKIARQYLCLEGKNAIFVHPICFGQNFLGAKTAKTKKHYNTQKEIYEKWCLVL